MLDYPVEKRCDVDCRYVTSDLSYDLQRGFLKLKAWGARSEDEEVLFWLLG